MKSKLEKIIELHQTMKNSYFFKIDLEIKEMYEESHSRITDFIWNNEKYKIVQETRVNEQGFVNYKVHYFIDDIEIKADIRMIKKILTLVSESL